MAMRFSSSASESGLLLPMMLLKNRALGAVGAGRITPAR
jgi:hypothetical protein